MEAIFILITLSSLILESSCGAVYKLGAFRSVHYVFKIWSSDVAANDVIEPPEIVNTVYVDGLNGSDDNDGASEDTAFRSLKHAIQNTGNKTKFYVMNGEYNNDNFGNGVDNGAIMTIRVKTILMFHIVLILSLG